MKYSPRISRLTAALILSSLLLGSCSWIRDPAHSGPTPTGSRKIQIQPDHRTCSTAADCAMVLFDCSGCSCGTAINKTYLEEYRAAYHEYCQAYSGPVCDFYCPVDELVCRAGQCEFVPRED